MMRQLAPTITGHGSVSRGARRDELNVTGSFEGMRCRPRGAFASEQGHGSRRRVITIDRDQSDEGSISGSVYLDPRGSGGPAKA